MKTQKRELGRSVVIKTNGEENKRGEQNKPINLINLPLTSVSALVKLKRFKSIFFLRFEHLKDKNQSKMHLGRLSMMLEACWILGQ